MNALNTPYDVLHKSLMRGALALFGRVSTQVELVGEPLFADVLFRAGSVSAAVDQLGLLGRMLSSGVCLFEPHSTNPRDGDLRSALRKLWIAAEPDTSGDSGGEHACSWVLSPGRPGALLERFQCARDADWPAGVYRSRVEPRMAVVALRELPRRRDTLLLRLMGRGTTFGRALDDLLDLAEDDLISQVALPVVLRWARQLKETRDDLRLRPPCDPTNEEATMRASEWLEKYNNQQRSEARRDDLVRLFELRLERALSETERASVETRLETEGYDSLARVVLERDAHALAQWLAEHRAEVGD